MFVQAVRPFPCLSWIPWYHPTAYFEQKHETGVHRCSKDSSLPDSFTRPHLFQAKLLNTCFVRRDRRTFYAHIVLLCEEWEHSQKKYTGLFRLLKALLCSNTTCWHLLNTRIPGSVAIMPTCNSVSGIHTQTHTHTHIYTQTHTLYIYKNTLYIYSHTPWWPGQPLLWPERIRKDGKRRAFEEQN